MGYYTRFELIILDPMTASQMDEVTLKGLDFYPSLELDVQKIDHENGFFFDAGTNTFWMEESPKWYNYEDGMLALSKKYPDVIFLLEGEGVIFLLEGEGEETLDSWKEYFLNGRNQHREAIITYEPLDLLNLQGYAEDPIPLTTRLSLCGEV